MTHLHGSSEKAAGGQCPHGGRGKDRLALFFVVREAVCRGSDRLADEACKDSQRKDVWQNKCKPGRQLGSDTRDGDDGLHDLARSKQQRRSKSAKWGPLAKDHGGQTNEPDTVGHGVAESRE